MIDRDESGRICFKVYRPGAHRVQLVASFTTWDRKPIDLHKAENGWWTVTLELDPGDHEFQYLIDGREWLGDFACDGVRMNDFSQWLGLIHIEASATAAPHVVVRRAATRQPASNSHVA